MSRLKISQKSADYLTLRSEFDAGEVVGCGLVCVALVVTGLLVAITGTWTWLIPGIIFGMVGSKVAAAVTPSPGAKLYHFDRVNRCLRIQEVNRSGQVCRDETYPLSQVGEAQVQKWESQEIYKSALSGRMVLTLPVAHREIRLEDEYGDTTREDLAALADAINSFLNRP